MLNRSLKVGTMTSARSANAPPIAPKPDYKHHQTNQDGDPGYNLPPFVAGTGESQRDISGAGGKLHADHGVIDSADVRWLSINAGQPTGIIILGDYERRSGRCRCTQRDINLPRLI